MKRLIFLLLIASIGFSTVIGVRTSASIGERYSGTNRYNVSLGVSVAENAYMVSYGGGDLEYIGFVLDKSYSYPIRGKFGVCGSFLSGIGYNLTSEKPAIFNGLTVGLYWSYFELFYSYTSLSYHHKEAMRVESPYFGIAFEYP